MQSYLPNKVACKIDLQVINHNRHEKWGLQAICEPLHCLNEVRIREEKITEQER